MKSYFALIFLVSQIASLAASQAQAGPKDHCIALINNELGKFKMGTFYKPASEVSKIPRENGVIDFSVSAYGVATQSITAFPVTNGSGTIVISQKSALAKSGTMISYNNNCKITEVISAGGSGLMGQNGAVGFRANPTECASTRSSAAGSQYSGFGVGMLGVPSLPTVVLCDLYFKQQRRSQSGVIAKNATVISITGKTIK